MTFNLSPLETPGTLIEMSHKNSSYTYTESGIDAVDYTTRIYTVLVNNLIRYTMSEDF